MKGRFRGKRRSRKAAQKTRARARWLHLKRMKSARRVLARLNEELYFGTKRAPKHDDVRGFETILTQDGRRIEFAEGVEITFVGQEGIHRGTAVKMSVLDL